MACEAEAKSTVQQAMDQGRSAAENSRPNRKRMAIKAARQYAGDNGLSLDVGDFGRREPWLAITAAFAIGYVAAQIIRRVS